MPLPPPLSDPNAPPKYQNVVGQIMDANAERARQQEEDRQRKIADDAARQKEQAAAAARAASDQTMQENTAKRALLPGTMRVDALQWAAHPAYRAKAFSQVPGEVPSHFVDAYGDVAGNLADEWNKAQREVTGDQTIGIPAEIGGMQRAGATVDKSGNTQFHYQAEKPAAVPADIRSELIRLHAWKDGMTPEEAAEARDNAYMSSGMIPEKYMKQATTLIGQIQRHPVLAPFAKQKEAYETMKSGFENPQSGGFGDMAMIEGFQRIVNPGAVVRQQTMNQMLQAAGLGQYGSWDFLKNKLMNGDKLSPQVRQKLMSLAEDQFQTAHNTAARELYAKQRLAQRFGIPNPEEFVNSILNIVANDEQPGTPGTPFVATPQAAPNATAPARPNTGQGRAQTDAARNAQPAPQPVPRASPQKIQLATQALNDPSATEAEKAAARRILGQ